MGKRIELRMLRRSFVIWVCAFVLNGCVYEEPMPQIVYDHRPSRVVKRSSPPPARVPTLSASGNIPREWVPPSGIERKWTAIVIHHSGTSNGNTAIFDKWHKEGRHWEGVGYDFVIGNGTGSGDGQVEVTFRWRQQRTGAHCKTPENWANEEAVGICLVGNFNWGAPSQRQMQSLVKLVRFLQKRYRIPRDRIYGHKSTPGALVVTDCPGKSFPMAKLKLMLDF